jgi:methyltransferase-like protein/2-polyprenyl-3-methyl-5-hydroxy-6-metoxy-1,4-benzoquinol methylase
MFWPMTEPACQRPGARPEGVQTVWFFERRAGNVIEMPEPTPTAYDTVAYPGYAYVQTHPDHIATLARLCGLSPAPLDQCRVLEVGCGDGANLIPMALAFPHASFRGFDLAASAIERGQAIVRELSIANLTLEQIDICEAPDRIGEFDYVIAHGFYSWVPPAARNKLMTICRASLAPQGVAFISYNAYPGGHIRRMVREMMLFHVERAPDAQKKTIQARALLGFLSNLTAGEDEYQLILKKEFERVQKYQPAHLFHDDLAPICDSFYLYEFVNHAAEHGLQFLSDLNSSFVHVGGLNPESLRALSELEGDPILREQYLDFACCRRFRQTLLCHAGLTVSYQLDTRRLEGLLVSSSATQVSGTVNLEPDVEEEFRGARNASLKTSHPVMKAAMVALRSVWPERLSLEELRSAAAARTGAAADSIPSGLLSEGIATAFTMRVLDLHVHRSLATSRPGEYPLTSPLARWQAGKGGVLTNLIHQSVKVEGDGLQLLSLLDGKRNRGDLARELRASPEEIDQALAHLAALALLEA